MKVLVGLEKRFSVTPDGTIWSQGWLDANFWDRYLDEFESVEVFARVLPVDSPPPRSRVASRPEVTFLDVPFYKGPWQYARNIGRLRRAAATAISNADAIVCRAPGGMSSLLYRAARRARMPFGVEVVGDPYDVFDPKAMKNALRPFLRFWVTRELRQMCQNAAAVSYVTSASLQQRYPAGEGSFSTSYSSINLDDIDFVAGPRTTFSPDHRILFIGSLAQLYKAPDVLLEAFSLVRQEMPASLTLIGDGAYRPHLEAMAKSLGIDADVTFRGVLPAGEAIRNALDDCDLFVLPSHTEGLPRVMIEAMARAAPCIGTSISGILELLPNDLCVAPGDSQALARKICNVLRDRDGLAQLSARNFEEASQYHIRHLRPKRRSFLSVLKAGCRK
ncbi:MAG: glycosyltransferase family 4 protein [Phycisphaerae bacterium]